MARGITVVLALLAGLATTAFVTGQGGRPGPELRLHFAFRRVVRDCDFRCFKPLNS